MRAAIWKQCMILLDGERRRAANSEGKISELDQRI